MASASLTSPSAVNLGGPDGFDPSGQEATRPVMCGDGANDVLHHPSIRIFRRSVAERQRDSGHELLGLARTPVKAHLLQECGIESVVGTLDDTAILRNAARRADGVI